ncbi:response regulator [Flavobacterium sp. UBA4197]|uniref:response regulator n=1 Tax=Flavobacterium sp. UBA4197 TaxID=1946546 RepID=UPI00257CC6C9|nr:response regulator [Flavobacterium sp. UBA4197]
MFRKILIAEDFDTVNLGVKQLLEEFAPKENIQHVQYCDDALLKVKRALFDKEPFDLLISDLSFVENTFRENKLNSGEELIAAIRKEQPDIKVIVYSVETKPYVIKYLLEELDCNAYISKSRESMREFRQAIKVIFGSDEKFVSPELKYSKAETELDEIDELDIKIIAALSKGADQNEIADDLNYSRSSIEKRINRLKTSLKAKNNPHLVAISKDLGLI